MSIRHSVVLQNATGDKQTGKDVKLYEFGKTPGVDPPVGTYTDNSDGSYYIAVSTTGKYSVAVEGVLQAELTGIQIVADDITLATITGKADKVGAAVNGNLAGLNASGNLTDSGYAPSDFLDSDHVNADGAGGTSAPAANKVHHAAAIEVDDSGGYFSGADVENVLQEMGEKIGDNNYLTAPWLRALTSPDISDCLRELANRVWNNYQKIFQGNDPSYYQAAQFFFSNEISGNDDDYHQFGFMTFEYDVVIDRIDAYTEASPVYPSNARIGWQICDAGASPSFSTDFILAHSQSGYVGGAISTAMNMGQHFRLALMTDASETANLYGHAHIQYHLV